MSKDIHITLDSGRGLLDARALWASVVGPHRLAMAQRVRVPLTTNGAVELSKVLGVSDCYVLVGIAAVPGGGDRAIFIGREDTLGNGSWPVELADGAGNRDRVTVLLAPGEQLYAQPQNNDEEFTILVAAAVF